MCVNQSTKQEGLYLSNQLSHPSTVTNRLTIIKGLLTVIMVHCAAFGCYILHRKGCGKTFTFTKDTVRRKAWTMFSKSEAFVPTMNFRLCSDSFKGPDSTGSCQLEPYGYDGARIRLKPDAVPDVPLHIKSENKVVLPRRPRGAYIKRQKTDVSNLLIYNVILFCFYGKWPVSL